MVWSELGNATGNALDFGTKAAPSWFSGIGDTLNKGFSGIGDTLNKGFDWMNDNSKALGVGGQLFSAYNQYNMGNKVFDMQKDAYNYNKSLSEREKKRQEEAEKQLQYGFNNSGMGAGV